MTPKTPTKSDLFDFQQSILMKEIDYIHSQISNFDRLSFQIKGWAVTLWSAIVAFGASQTSVLVVLASIPVMVTFWILDAFFKQYQHRFTSRMGFIEMFFDSRDFFRESGLRTTFQNKDFGDFPLHDPIAHRTRKLSADFEKKFKSNTKYRRGFFVPNVGYFYALLILCSVILAIAVS
jgi:hypothetical protein